MAPSVVNFRRHSPEGDSSVRLAPTPVPPPGTMLFTVGCTGFSVKKSVAQDLNVLNAGALLNAAQSRLNSSWLAAHNLHPPSASRIATRALIDSLQRALYRPCRSAPP